MNILKPFYLPILLLLITVSAGCVTSNECRWVNDQNTGTRIWLSNANPTLTYVWEGERFDSVAHGNGILYVIDNGSVVEQRTAKAYYGALEENDIVSVSDTEAYVGGIIDEKFDGYGVYHKNGEIYIGNFKDSKPHGYATWYKNGKPYYVGMWANGKFHGEGTLYKEDGSIKTGDWENGTLTQTLVDVELSNGHYNGYVKNNKPDGIGRMEYANGSVYSGIWKYGKWNGNGTYHLNDSATITSIWTDGVLDGPTIIKSPEYAYEGGYLEGYPHGLCQISIPNIYQYFGYMGDGVKSGYGEIAFSSGDSYRGDWYDNMFDGNGIYIYHQEHAKYDGQWYQGLQNGIGYYQCPEFAYRGEWEDGWINGYGKMVFSNKDQYIGSFVENQFYGDGSYLFSNGNQYDGEFFEGKFNGLGTFHFKNGDIYTGEFKDGEIFGDGTLTIYENGKPIIITAHWVGNNKFPTYGSILFSNGDIYEGELIEGIPTRNGKWTSVSDITHNQSWADNAADYYNNHFEEIQKIRKGIKYVAIGIGGAAAIASCAVIVVGTGGTAAPVIAAIASGLGTASSIAGGISTLAEVSNTAISSYDDYRNTDDEDEKASIKSDAMKDISMEVALAVLPRVRIKSANRVSKLKFSKSIKNVGKKSEVTISNKKVFGKVITVSKNNGIYVKNSITTTNQNIKNIRSKVTPVSIQKLNKAVATGIKTYRSLEKQKDLQAIILNETEIQSLIQSPKTIRSVIKKYTGNHNYFEEFFIRLALGSKEQVTELFNIPYICKFVDRCIRLSDNTSNQELMGQTFCDFLTNPKYGSNGQILALFQIQLTRKLAKATITNENIKSKSIAQISSDLDRLNDYIARELSSGSDKEEILSKAKSIAIKYLSSSEYDEFDQMWQSL